MMRGAIAAASGLLRSHSLVREVVLTRDAGAKGAGGVTSVGIGWRSGAWTELAVRRPTTGDHMRTPATALARIRAGAPTMTDERLAAALNADGLTTRMGLPWTAMRVERVRAYQRIPTGCPVMPRTGRPRGDGLVPARVAATLLRVEPTALAHWRRWGFVHVEQRGPGSPLWIRLTPEDRARLDGTMAARGHGRWPLREARRVLGLTQEQLWEKARRQELVAYRARVADHWEWRVSPAGDEDSSVVDSSPSQ
jgi:hypothetical protein